MNENRLHSETSPYLRQHADNPVAWQPWDEQALQQARTLNRPILLSIGYSACHWCHVMEHESFEDEGTARVMNELFINIKVDREERPDLDKIYQLSHQLLSQRGGGWPLTVFLEPGTQIPFFAGTYFPPEARHGLPAFKDLLVRIRNFFDHHQEELAKQNASLMDALNSLNRSEPHRESINKAPLEAAATELGRYYDSLNGGFGGAPKFPQTPLLELARVLSGSHPEHRAALQHSLQKMADGGLQDHLGGGFFRYTVDDDWSIPHFEKMLYDNAQLLPVYAAAAASGDSAAAVVVDGTVQWLNTEMRTEDGIFYSSMDADSEGREGKYYVWGADDIAELLADNAHQAFIHRYGLNLPPNFERRYWHLKVRQPIDTVAANLKLDSGLTGRRIEQTHRHLLQHRSERIRPARDDKRLTAWNALAISGLARSARYLRRPVLADSAALAMDTLVDKTWVDGRLYASYQHRRARFPAYLDDHAFLLQALMELLAVRWSDPYLHLAVTLADRLLDHFQDPSQGGFFFTGKHHEKLIQRQKTLQDDALPNGNGIAAQSLLKLGHLLGDNRYLKAAESTLRTAWEAMQRAPLGHATLLTALQQYLEPAAQVILIGPEDQCLEWRKKLPVLDIRCYLPGRDTGHLPGLLAHYNVEGPVTAYVCSGQRCLPPVTELKSLQEQLKTV